MDVDTAISGGNPGSSLRKSKRKKHSADKITDSNHGSAKDVALAPANVEATAANSPTVGTLRKTKRAKKMKKRSDIDSVEISANDRESSVVVPENVEASNSEPAVGKRKKKRRKEKAERNAGLEIETAIPAKIEATKFDSEARESPEKKRKKKKKRRGDFEMKTVDSDTTVLDSGADIAPLEKKKKRKTTKSDDLEMKTVDHENSSVPSNAEPALVTTNLDSMPGVAPLEKTKKKRKKKKKSVDLETKAMDSENNLALSKVEAALDTMNMNSETEFAPVETKRKRKTKKKNDVEVPNADNGGISIDHAADAAPGESKMKKKTENGECPEIKNVEAAEEATVLGENGKKNLGIFARLKDKSNMERLKKRKSQTEIKNIQRSAKESIREERLIPETSEDKNSTAVKEDSSASMEQCGLQIGPSTSSIAKNNDGSETGHLLESKKAEMGSETPVEVLDEQVICSSNVEMKEKNPTQSSRLRSLVCKFRKKLLILDVNGILVDFVNYNPAPYKADIVISKKYVFKRPYCDEFLKFCFERFDVGVWSSRVRWNMEKAVNFLLWEYKDKLLFCWDQSHCTMTGFNTIDNQSKPLVLKELKNVWRNLKPGLPFEAGAYDETNTLLLDDSPYKALRNPANTAIFPNPYSYTDEDDNALGPDGDLRAYLERLYNSGDISVRRYIEQNPFGQPAITESHKSWDFYSKIANAEESRSKM